MMYEIFDSSISSNRVYVRVLVNKTVFKHKSSCGYEKNRVEILSP